MYELKYAQDVIKTHNKSVDCGFNMFVSGDGYPLSSEYHDHVARQLGYDYAKELAEDGKIAFTNKFKCNCGGYPFLFGGFWVCNDCGGKGVDKEWWKIVVEKDGNEFCCHGLDFIDLQSSTNYAFGKTFEIAIENYGKIMI